MKKIFLSFVIVAIALSFPQSAYAAEMYSPAKSWEARYGNGQAYLKHVEYDLDDNYKPSAVYQTFTLQDGISLWEVSTTQGVRVHNQILSNYTTTASGLILHMVPTARFWKLYDGGPYWYYNGLTFNYDSAGNEIRTTTAGETGDIAWATIFYRPEIEDEMDSMYDLTHAKMSSLIAHEVGHALGFGHPDHDFTSVMMPAAYPSTLNQNDKNALCAKYPRVS